MITTETNQVLISGSTVFLEFLPGLESGYEACARAVEAGGITTIAGHKWNCMGSILTHGVRKLSNIESQNKKIFCLMSDVILSLKIKLDYKFLSFKSIHM